MFMSQVPLFQNDVLKKIPIVAGYFEGESSQFLAAHRSLPSYLTLVPLTDTTPDEDKPF